MTLKRGSTGATVLAVRDAQVVEAGTLDALIGPRLRNGHTIISSSGKL